MNLETIIDLTTQDMTAVNTMIREQFHSEVTLIKKICYYILNKRGKCIRPMLAILIARALRYDGKEHIKIAALIEFIHTATLIHDDVIDESKIRRSKYTSNTIFGNSASILVGDFLYTRAFQIMTHLNSLRILSLMSETVNVIAEGEVLQLMNINNSNISENSYMRVIYSKTARLFESTAQVSAILSGANEIQEKSFQDYGRYLGTAFQLIDDLLDYSTEGAYLGKKTGKDFKEGKVTLPILHAINNGNIKQVSIIRSAIEQSNNHHLLPPILSIMNQCGSLSYTQHRAEKEAKKAISVLKVFPESPYRTALEYIAHLSVNRDFSQDSS